MTDHATTVVADQIVSRPRQTVTIGRVKTASPSPLVGRQHDQLGFGLDASPAFVNAFIHAMENVECHPPRVDWRKGQRPDIVQGSWQSSIVARLARAPSSMKNVFDATLARLVFPHQRLLLTQLVPSSVNLGYLHTEFPRVHDEGTSTYFPGWRYQVTAELLWYGLGPHLRTTEMIDANAVWRQLNEYFRDIQKLDGRWATMLHHQRRREYASFLLAIYEQTIRLLDEQWQHSDRYRLTISQRPVAEWLGSEVILRFSTEALTDESLAEAHAIRVLAYDDLLMTTLANCCASLACLR